MAFDPNHDADPYLVHTTINVPAEPVEEDVSPFQDDYHLDSSDCSGDGDEHTLSEKMVHYVGGHVAPEHWTACKATIVFYAGAHTSKSAVMNKAGKESACLETYQTAILALDSEFFSAEAIAFFSHSFKKKDEPMGAEALYRYYQDSRNKMRSLIIPLFPVSFASMKSGKGFHESCNAVFVSAYRKELMRTKRMSKEEADQELPPHLWEYRKNPWFLALAVKVFRRDPQLAPNVADVMTDKENVPISRANLLRLKQKKAAAAIKVEHAVKKKIHGGSDASSLKIQRSVARAKLHTARALELQSNIAQRLGRIRELESAMNLLDRMRSIIGEDEYAQRVASVAASFPVFATFNADVSVVVIDDDNEDEGRRRTSSPCPSSTSSKDHSNSS
jgi:hypothetical protein